jgi:diguanylate cyclase (GGDEF)-like protein/PAS domain S-box-containing protein
MPPGELDDRVRDAIIASFEGSPIAQGIVTPDATITYANAAAREMLGYSLEEMAGLGFGVLISGESMTHLMNAILAVASSDRSAVELDVWIEPKNSAPRQVHVIGGAVQDNDGQLRFFTAAAYDVTEQRERESVLGHRAAHDALTGLPNRPWFVERLRQALARAERERTRLAVFFVDLDTFKEINDEHGHEVGDQVLFSVAGHLKSVIRPGDTIARYGGDEFIILCEDIPDGGQATEIAERIVGAARERVATTIGETGLTASVGVAITAAGETSPDAVIRAADAAMYQAKRDGKGAYRVSTMPDRA